MQIETESDDDPVVGVVGAAPPASGDGAAPDVTVLYPDDQPEGATSDQSVDEGSKSPKDAEVTSVATEGEVFDLHMPEGVQLDREMLTEAMPVFRDAGISRDQAQKLIPLVSEVQQRVYDQQNDEFAKTRAEWAKSAKQDRQIGGERFKETQRLVGVALRAGGAESKTHEIRELMDESGLGNHPSVLRVFRRLGEIIEGYQRKEALAARQRPASREESLYPDDTLRR